MNRILHFMLSAVVLVLFGIIFTIGATMTAVNYAIMSITPQAELPRSQEGHIIVNWENYKDWHTYSKLFHSSSGKAIINEDFVLRAIPTAKTTCRGIKNCSNYESEFYEISYKQPLVYLVKKQDDTKVSQYIQSYKKAVKLHNKEITHFDSDVSLELPELDLAFAEQISVDTSAEQPNSTDRAVRFAAKQCRNNGRGSDVAVKLVYSFIGLPHVNFEVSKT